MPAKLWFTDKITSATDALFAALHKILVTIKKAQAHFNVTQAFSDARDAIVASGSTVKEVSRVYDVACCHFKDSSLGSWLGLERAGRSASKKREKAKFVPGSGLNVDVAKDALANKLAELSIADVTPPINAENNNQSESNSNAEVESTEILSESRITTRKSTASSRSPNSAFQSTPHNSHDNIACKQVNSNNAQKPRRNAQCKAEVNHHFYFSTDDGRQMKI